MFQNYIAIFVAFTGFVSSEVLPSPTGPYAVSFTDIIDKAGINGSFFRIYFPTEQFDANNVTFPNWTEPEYLASMKLYMSALKNFPLSIPINVPFSLPQNLQKLPVLLFSHGLIQSKNSYSFICSDLASYGFLVAAIDHKDRSAITSLYLEESEDSDGYYERKFVEPLLATYGTEEDISVRTQQVEVRIQNLKKVMDALEQLNEGLLTSIYYPEFNLTAFKGKLDLNKAGVIGHSHGGATAIVSIFKDDRFKLAIALDPWMPVVDKKYLKQKVDKPLMFINSVGFLQKEDILKMRQLDGDVTGITADRLIVTLLGSAHYTQTDFSFFPVSFLQTIAEVVETDAKVSNAINTNLMLNFLNKQFKLSGPKDIDSIVVQHSKYVITGSDVSVTEEEVAEAKRVITSSSKKSEQ